MTTCILTAENMHTADDCTLHEHEPDRNNLSNRDMAAQDNLLDEATHAAANIFAERGVTLETEELHRINDLLTEILGDRVPNDEEVMRHSNGRI